MQDFLQLKQFTATGNGAGTGAGTEAGGGAMAKAALPSEKKVDLRVLLPDRSVIMVTINEFWRTPEVYQVRSHGRRVGGARLASFPGFTCGKAASVLCIATNA